MKFVEWPAASESRLRGRRAGSRLPTGHTGGSGLSAPRGSCHRRTVACRPCRHRPERQYRTGLGRAIRPAEIVKVLLAHGLDPLHVDDDKNTPLSLAVRKKKSEVVRPLIAAIPRERYREVRVADQIWFAAYLEDTATLRYLLEAGVSPDYLASQGNTALISAVGDGNLERVKQLLKHGATVEENRYKGRNIFKIAEASLSNG